MLYEVITNVAIPVAGFKDVYSIADEFATSISGRDFKQEIEQRRITSYNVCYTKLLRGGPYLAGGIALDARQHSCHHEIHRGDNQRSHRE